MREVMGEKMNNEIYVTDILKDIFDNVNTWVHFAEAKNAAIIGVNGLFLFKLIEIMIDIFNEDANGNICIVAILSIVFIVALVTSVFSFFSNTSAFDDDITATEEDTKIDRKNILKVEDRILIFYGHIKHYKSSQNYLADIYKHYRNESVTKESLRKLELDYSKEILINSRIATRKYQLFNFALKVNLLGIILVGLLIIIA